MAISAPTTQPAIACGPPIATRISGIVMNGPRPTICDMFRAIAEDSPSPLIRPLLSVITSLAGTTSATLVRLKYLTLLPRGLERQTARSACDRRRGDGFVIGNPSPH